MRQDIYISGEDLKDQREIMVEEHGMPEEKAQEIYEDMKTFVMLQSQEQGKDWGEEAVDAVTNLLISIQHQVNQRHYVNRQRFYGRLYNLISTGILGAAAGVFAIAVYAGSVVPAVIIGAGFLALTIAHIRNA